MRTAKPKKSKMMKRLPPNWGDNLTLDDIDWTIQHFRDCLVDYTAMLANPLEDVYGHTLASKSIPVVQSRIALWERVRALRVAGQSIMPLLRENRVTA